MIKQEMDGEQLPIFRTKRRIKSRNIAIEHNSVARGVDVDHETRQPVRRAATVRVLINKIRMALETAFQNMSDPDEDLVVSVEDLNLSQETYSYSRLRSVVKPILSESREAKDLQTGEITFYNVYDSIKYVPKKGIIRARFTETMKSNLRATDAGNFAKVANPVYQTLETPAGQAIFEWLCSWRNHPGLVSIKLEELHKICLATEYQKENYRNFKQAVLKPALEDLKQNAHLDDLTMVERRVGRKVSEIFFSGFQDTLTKAIYAEDPNEKKIFAPPKTLYASHSIESAEVEAANCRSDIDEGLIKCHPRKGYLPCEICQKNHIRYHDRLEQLGLKG
jgi:hypothetical protein